MCVCMHVCVHYARVCVCVRACARVYDGMYVYLSHWPTLLSHHNLVMSNLSILHVSLLYHGMSSSPVIEYTLIFTTMYSQDNN